MNRRHFLAATAGSIVTATVSACNSYGPGGAKSVLRYAERKNEQLERWLFRSGSRNRVAADAPLTGRAFPRYFISERMPMWNEAERGGWRLEVSGAVKNPLSLTLDDLVR